MPSWERIGYWLLPLHELQCLHGPYTSSACMQREVLYGQLPNLPWRYLHIQLPREGPSMRSSDALNMFSGTPIYKSSISLSWFCKYLDKLTGAFHADSRNTPILNIPAQSVASHLGTWRYITLLSSLDTPTLWSDI